MTQPHFNANNFELAAVEGLYSFQITTSAYEDDLPSLLNAANSTMFFVYKEGGEPGPQYTNRLFKPLLEDVQNSGKFFELSIDPVLPGLPVLPDGGKVVIYQNRWPNSAIIKGYFFDPASADSGDIQVSACAVNFSNLMKLTGLSFSIEKEWLKVGYRLAVHRKTGSRPLLFHAHSRPIKAKSWGFWITPFWAGLW